MSTRTGKRPAAQPTPAQLARANMRLRGIERAKWARSHPSVLRASGVKIERMSAEKLRAVAGQRQSWQKLAWGYRDLIGELRGALQFRARALFRARFFVGQLMDDNDEPMPLSYRDERDDSGALTERAQKITISPQLAEAAEAELARLPLDSGYSFLGVWSENFDVAGECWLYGRINPDTGEEEWSIRSVDDINPQGSNITVKDELGQPRIIDLSPDSGEELYRLWVPHPAHPYLADSALNACMDSLEEICLTGREMRAASRSRVAANGVLKVPNGLTKQRNIKEDDERTPQDKFQADLTAAFLAPISNEGEPGAVVPMMIFGDPEDLKGLEHIRFEREDSPTLIDKLNKALARMAQSIDVPPEIITGMAEVNHWTAWQIDASTFRYYLEPGLRLMVDTLTVCFLRNALRGQFPPEELAKIRVWFDAGAITENPNRRTDAIDAFDRGGIGPRTLRNELGYSEGDEPTMEELLMMVALKNGFDQAAVAKVLQYFAEQQGVDVPDLSTPPAQIPAARAALPPARQDPAGVGGTGQPETAPTGVTSSGYPGWPALPAEPAVVTYPDAGFVAAAAKQESEKNSPKWRLDSATGQKLADIERALRDQILLAADQAVTRALERAGSRLRSKAQKDQALVHQLRRLPIGQWAMTMGREQAFALGADLRFLLKSAFDDLGDKFRTWVSDAVGKLVARVLAFLGLKPGTREYNAAEERMRAGMASRTGPAWTRFHEALTVRVERLLFDGEGEPLADGETTTVVIPPWMVRNALADIGGLPETASGFDARGNIPTGEPTTGMADGTTVTRELATHGIVTLGREWRYNPTLIRHTFEPHEELDGTRFTSWTDDALRTDIAHAWIGEFYRPGDHEGCLCTAVPTYAIPDTPPPTPPGQAAPTETDERDWNKALAEQLRERLGQPSQDMAYLIELAETDDRAGRMFTTAQQTRDTWLEVQRLKNQFLNGE